MKLINDFLNILNESSSDILIKTSKKAYTKKDVLTDIKKVATCLKEKNIKKGSRCLILINKSYEMYIAIIGSILYGVQVVVIDNFKDKVKLKEMITGVDITYVLTNNITNLITPFIKPLSKISKINIQKVIKRKNIGDFIFENITLSQEDTCLITFTSGGTGKPKSVARTFNELQKQLDLTLFLVSIKKNTYVLATLPIYTLACIIKGVKIYIPKKKEKLDSVLKQENITMCFASISTFLSLNDSFEKVEEVLFGGSILYYKEALKIKHLFPSATIKYIYGATEASIISITNIDSYIPHLEKNNLCLGRVLDTNIVTSIDSELVVKKGLITNNYLNIDHESFHRTGDLGDVIDNQIYIKGRIISYDIVSDYILELIVKKEFDDIFNIAILKIKNEYHIYIEEKDIEKRIKIALILDNHIKNGIIHVVKKLPLDYRHNQKIDYKKLLKDEGVKYV